MASWFTEDMEQVAGSMKQFCAPGEQYDGPDGAVELGKLMGSFVWDHAGDDRRVAGIYIKATYGGICKVCYRDNPPIDVERWKQAVREGYEQECERQKKAEEI